MASEEADTSNPFSVTVNPQTCPECPVNVPLQLSVTSTAGLRADETTGRRSKCKSN